MTLAAALMAAYDVRGRGRVAPPSSRIAARWRLSILVARALSFYYSAVHIINVRSELGWCE